MRNDEKAHVMWRAPLASGPAPAGSMEEAKEKEKRHPEAAWTRICASQRGRAGRRNLPPSAGGLPAPAAARLSCGPAIGVPATGANILFCTVGMGFFSFTVEDFEGLGDRSASRMASGEDR